MGLNGKVACITGAAGGIGLAIAQRFAKDGAKVVISDVLEELGQSEARAIRDAGGNAQFFSADTTSESSVDALLAATADAYGPVDIAVCSAGIARGGKPFHETELADFESVLNVNLIGAFLFGKAVARQMVDRKAKGTIINVSSVGGVLAVAESPAYCVSKAGLGMLTKTMALALAPHGIRVNAIGPGPTTTPMTASLPPEAVDMMLSRTPLGRFGEAAEMAGVAAFLASDDAGFVTGQTIYADGGRLALNYLAQKPIDS